ncbi:MAG: UDP-N-acetylenolpyruvoylglucosamine reductase [Candidatus Collierbacteria bacterium GW2011_GWF2_44_15]|uniref:UDP-N-acetylenolpyruvoylglucosamine reductase n=4 Tax=Candidatus Collieribacteriota TaxID=1752725 RepID=A0A0G1HI60_9BACT|nr:MAG: UDP-N-acetylenolpyruvoylglucosamine reductase [Candidatus Collierbacteria bacterium GW2011_GWF1_44_12]KKT46595.1 MAG: UDP-N-acetylenolpyruvoylglucosamine reductase [Candidatus Collierbacteria bacterium GW2011_GWF2_44_15]KKT96956.1 MAG: UDP-N-acetylenolpyruvoylglucosamine reductase [Candidatus Collierbacteria bacterium GW2011_GWC2_45_15]KKU29542.1 MAG: UDP-N-acetylenolpyruvoylglucosamine reductase [Candidatus Collierbacteria bacterium GW2011_GWE1_46_18]
MSNLNTLIKALGEDRIKRDESLSHHTTLGVGGKAELFFKAESTGELIGAVRLARNLGIQVTVIGGGSNILVGDRGVKGLVVKNFSNRISVGKKRKRAEAYPEKVVETRWQSDLEKGTFKYEFADLNYDEWDEERIEVVMDSGVSLQGSMARLIDQGITGLQWFARIPGTIGGAIYNNIHGGTHTIGEVLERVSILNKDGEIKTLSASELAMGYDTSRFHKTGEIITEVVLDLFLGDKSRAGAVAREWARRKAIQPSRSAGCVFKNISDIDQENLGYPTSSAGYLIEHVLKMSGFRVGGAMISESHHNFIINTGEASAKDYLAVKDEIVRRAKEELGIDLESEIVLLGEF